MKATDFLDFIHEASTGYVINKGSRFWTESDEWTDDVNAAKIYPTKDEAGMLLVSKIKSKQFEVADDYDVLKVKVMQ